MSAMGLSRIGAVQADPRSFLAPDHPQPSGGSWKIEQQQFGAFGGGKDYHLHHAFSVGLAGLFMPMIAAWEVKGVVVDQQHAEHAGTLEPDPEAKTGASHAR